jgi:hypothetical protein
VLEAFFIVAEKVLPVIAEDPVKRIISETAGAVCHGEYPAGDKSGPGYLRGKIGAGVWVQEDVIDKRVSTRLLQRKDKYRGCGKSGPGV